MPAKKTLANNTKEGSAAGAALRMIRMLRLIPREPNKVTARQLSELLGNEGFQIEKRSVERDLRALQQAEGLGCDERNEPFGWYWPKGRKTLQAADMTPAEALALYLGKKYLSEILPPAVHEEISPFIAAAEDALKRNPLSRRSAWRNKVAVVPANQPLLPPKRNLVVEQVVYQALLDGKQLEIRYGAAGTEGENEVKCHPVHPLGLVQRGAATYLVARFYDYQEPRILAMHRILSAAASLKDASPPDGFTLEGYLEQGEFGFHGSNQEIHLKLSVTEDIAGFLEETRLSADQEIDRTAERPVVKATVRDNAVLERWLMSLGSGAQVVSPAQLRKRVAAAHKSAAAAYASPPS